MELAVVVGQVVATVKNAGMTGDRLLLVDPIGTDGTPKGVPRVAVDAVGAGNGEWVLIVSGSSARRTMNDQVPVDLSVVGIVDEVVVGDRVVYHK